MPKNLVKKVVEIMGKFFYSFLAVLFISAGVSLFSQQTLLKTDFQNTASKVIRGSNGNFIGICIDLMNAIEKNSNLKFQYPKDFSPLLRIEDELNNGDIDVYFALIRNPDREAKCIFIEPLYTIQYLLIANADDKIVIKNIEDFKNAAKSTSILTVAGSTIVNYIQSLGLKADSGGKDVIDNFEKLKAGRAQFFIYQDLALIHDMNSEKYKNKFKIIPLELPTEELWVVTSKSTPENVRSNLKNTIKSLKASGEWDKIVTKNKNPRS
jgi:ABC-type amino acid transport substrate-binding protein